MKLERSKQSKNKLVSLSLRLVRMGERKREKEFSPEKEFMKSYQRMMVKMNFNELSAHLIDLLSQPELK